MSIFYVIVGFVLLITGGEFLVRSSVGISFKLKISKIIIGMTVVSFATSLPELIVSLQAALNGHADIAISNVIGSNIANIALVLGITAIISPLSIGKNFYKSDWPIMVAFSIVFWFFLQNDLIISRIEGLFLFASIIIFVILLVRKSKSGKLHIDENIDEAINESSNIKILFWLLLGALGLWLGSELLVKGAIDIAKKMGVSERTIGISMIAIGTSIPELAASVIAALKGEKSISIGNLIGSNIFNIGSVIGLTAIVSPIAIINKAVLNQDIVWMLAIATLLFPLVFLPKRMNIGRLKGVFLLLFYLVFLYFTFA